MLQGYMYPIYIAGECLLNSFRKPSVDDDLAVSTASAVFTVGSKSILIQWVELLTMQSANWYFAWRHLAVEEILRLHEMPCGDIDNI